MARTTRKRKCSTWNIDGKKVIPSEHDECLRFWQWAQLNPLLATYLIKNVNEGKRSFYVGKRLKAIGLRKGLPDYHLPYPNKNWRGLWLEMKRVDGKNKAKDHDQILWINKLRAIKQFAIFCYGADDAINAVIDYLNDRL